MQQRGLIEADDRQVKFDHHYTIDGSGEQPAPRFSCFKMFVGTAAPKLQSLLLYEKVVLLSLPTTLSVNECTGCTATAP